MSTSHAPRSSLRRLVLAAAAPAALVLATFAAGNVSAIGEAKYGTAAVIDADTGQQTVIGGEPHVCKFFFRIDMNETADLVGWKVKEWNATPFDGTTVLKGQGGPTDADGKLRVPDSGSFSLPNGRYNFLWDDEYPPDGSSGVQSFVVDCQAKATPTPTPTATPTETPTETPAATPTDTGTDLGVGGVVANAGGITPPPTDTSGGITAKQADNGGLVAILIAALSVLTGSTLLAPARMLRRKR
jgi:hypothetical protein